MSIRIIPQDQLEKSEKTTAEMIPPLLFPRLKNLYSRRAARLRDLAAKNPLGDYLRFAAVIAEAQEIVLYDHPLHTDLRARLAESAREGKPPLDIHTLPRDTHWHRLLHSLIAELKPEMSGQALAVLENLEKASATELETLASALFAGEYAQVSSDKAPFIWAALALYWAQMAAMIPGKARAEMGDQRQFCPVCASMPVASVVHMGSHDGARYLHCNLCESEWYVVRSKCTQCEQTRDLHYWSLDSEHAAVKAESCGDCGTYLKMLYQEKNPAIEPVADDLASLVLDARMEQEGFARSSLNPFMFPGESQLTWRNPMKLIGSYTSPFVRKISIIMLEKGIIFEFVNASPYSDDSHVPHYNPLGKVPALVADDQQIWFDSSIIAEFLELRGDAPALLPADPHQSLQIRQLEKLADGVSDAALVIVREQMRPGDQQSEEVLLRNREKIQRSLDMLEKIAAEGKWLNNGQLNLADIATGCMIGYLNFRRVVPNWCVERPALVKLAETLFQRESFARTTPPAA